MSKTLHLNLICDIERTKTLPIWIELLYPLLLALGIDKRYV